MKNLIKLGGVVLLLIALNGCAHNQSSININGNNNVVNVNQTANYGRAGYPVRYYREYSTYCSQYGSYVTPGYRDGYGFYYRGSNYNRGYYNRGYRYGNGYGYRSGRGTARRTARRTSRRVNRRH